MNTRTLVCYLLSYACLSACSQESHDGSDSIVAEQFPGLTPEQLERLEELMARENRGFVIPPRNAGRPGDRPDYSGEWTDHGGIKECDGYLTRFEDEEFCSSEIPSDWVPFAFEGRTFYVQPLSDNDS